MRTARKLTLLAALAVAATALAAPSALAQLVHNQTPRLIVQQEVHAANDINCPAVTPSPAPNPPPLATAGGCRVHLTSGVTGGIDFVFHTMGGSEVLDDTCHLEVDMRIDSSGEGYLTHQEFTGDQCELDPCDEDPLFNDEGRAWSFYMQEGEPAPRETMVLRICTEKLGAQVRPEFTIPLSQTSTHRYRLTASDVHEHTPVINTYELDGILESEAPLGTNGEGQLEQNVEIRHT